MKQSIMHLLYWLYIYSSDETGHNEILILSKILPWRSRSTTLQNNRDINQGFLHLCANFGDPSFNG